MRLFVAIELDDQARVAIAVEQNRLKRILGDGRSTLKWVRPEHMHLTLAFLGEVQESRSAALIETMREPIARPRLAIAFGGIGMFPPHGSPRVLWLGVSTGEAEVIAIQRVVADRLRRLDVELESRPFHPHLTLARWRTSRSADRQRALSVDHDTVVARVNVHHVTLYQSRLSSAGPSYTALARATLT